MKCYQNPRNHFYKNGQFVGSCNDLIAYKNVIIITVTIPFQNTFSGLLNVLNQTVYSDYMFWLVSTIITSSSNTICLQ